MVFHFHFTEPSFAVKQFLFLSRAVEFLVAKLKQMFTKTAREKAFTEAPKPFRFPGTLSRSGIDLLQ
jgi:hypothetical protein